MNKNQSFSFLGNLAGYLFLMAFLLAGCSKEKINLPDISDEPITAQVTETDISETVPVYGIVTGRRLEVNVEKEDAPNVMIGQKAHALLGSEKIPMECRVMKIIRDVNTATEMAIAWLKPIGEAHLSSGDFVSADIVLKVKHHVLTVPQNAVYIRDGQTMVLVKQTTKVGEEAYAPTQVQTGIVSGLNIEILSGLKAQEEVVTQAGIGYLYPDFKANAED